MKSIKSQEKKGGGSPVSLHTQGQQHLKVANFLSSLRLSPSSQRQFSHMLGNNFVKVRDCTRAWAALYPGCNKAVREIAAFSLNFSSAGKGPSIAGKAKNMCQRRTFLGEGGSGARDMPSTSLWNLGAKFSETSFPHLRPILRKSAVVTFRQQFKTFDSNYLTVFKCSLSKIPGPLKETLCILYYSSIYSFITLIGSDHNLRIF